MLKTYKTRSEIEKRITVLGEILTIHLSKDARERGVVLVGNLKGAFMFLSDLSKEISSMGCEVDFIQTNRNTVARDSLNLKHLSLKNKTIVFVDDIIDSGNTLKFIKQEFEKQDIHRFVSVALLVRGTESAKLVDYYGFQINTDKFVIGYGMDDIDGTKRNLPNIYLREEEKNG